MSVSSNSSLGFHDRMSTLELKLRESEFERLKLEEKFNRLLSNTKSQEANKLSQLRESYQQLLHQDWQRCERNDQILRTLERVENRAFMLTAKTDRLRLLKNNYDLYMSRRYEEWKKCDKKNSIPYESTRDRYQSSTSLQSTNSSTTLNFPQKFSITRRNSLVVPHLETLTSPKHSLSVDFENITILSRSSFGNSLLNNSKKHLKNDYEESDSVTKLFGNVRSDVLPLNFDHDLGNSFLRQDANSNVEGIFTTDKFNNSNTINRQSFMKIHEKPLENTTENQYVQTQSFDRYWPVRPSYKPSKQLTRSRSFSTLSDHSYKRDPAFLSEINTHYSRKPSVSYHTSSQPSSRSHSPRTSVSPIPKQIRSKSPLRVVDDIFKKYLINYDKRYLNDPISESKYGKYLYLPKNSYGDAKRASLDDLSSLYNTNIENSNYFYEKDFSFAKNKINGLNHPRVYKDDDNLYYPKKRDFESDRYNFQYSKNYDWKDWNYYRDRYEYPNNYSKHLYNNDGNLGISDFKGREKNSSSQSGIRDNDGSSFSSSKWCDPHLSYHRLNPLARNRSFNVKSEPERVTKNTEFSHDFLQKPNIAMELDDFKKKGNLKSLQTPKRVSFSNECLYDEKSDTELSASFDEISDYGKTFAKEFQNEGSENHIKSSNIVNIPNNYNTNDHFKFKTSENDSSSEADKEEDTLFKSSFKGNIKRRTSLFPQNELNDDLNPSTDEGVDRDMNISAVDRFNIDNKEIEPADESRRRTAIESDPMSKLGIDGERMTHPGSQNLKSSVDETCKNDNLSAEMKISQNSGEEIESIPFLSNNKIEDDLLQKMSSVQLNGHSASEVEERKNVRENEVDRTLQSTELTEDPVNSQSNNNYADHLEKTVIEPIELIQDFAATNSHPDLDTNYVNTEYNSDKSEHDLNQQHIDNNEQQNVNSEDTPCSNQILPDEASYQTQPVVDVQDKFKEDYNTYRDETQYQDQNISKVTHDVVDRDYKPEFKEDLHYDGQLTEPQNIPEQYETGYQEIPYQNQQQMLSNQQPYSADYVPEYQEEQQYQYDQKHIPEQYDQSAPVISDQQGIEQYDPQGTEQYDQQGLEQYDQEGIGQYSHQGPEQYNQSGIDQYDQQRADQYNQPGNQYDVEGTEQYEQQGMEQYGNQVAEQYGQPGTEHYGQPGNEQYGQPGTEQYGQPGTEQYGQPGTDQYGQPGTEQYGQPGIEKYDQPETEQYGQPGTEQYGQPGTEQYGQPGTEQYDQPGPEQYGQPGSEQYGQPELEQYGQSGTEQYGRPGTEHYGQPGAEQYGQPGTEQYDQPRPEQYGQPGTEQYGQPELEQYGQSGTEQFGQPGTEQYGQPGTEQYGQPGTEQYGQPGTEQYIEGGAEEYDPQYQGQPDQYGNYSYGYDGQGAMDESFTNIPASYSDNTNQEIYGETQQPYAEGDYIPHQQEYLVDPDQLQLHSGGVMDEANSQSYSPAVAPNPSEAPPNISQVLDSDPDSVLAKAAVPEDDSSDFDFSSEKK